MSLIENERIKLLATALNNGAVGTFVAGVVAPTFLLVANERAPILLVASVQFFWIFIGVSLHLLARKVLEGLKE